MSVAGSQQRTFLRLVAELRPHWHRDPALPARIQSLLAANRAFGSRDRRLYRELIYTTLRYLPWIESLLKAQPDEAIRRIAWLVAESPATHPFTAAFATGEPFAGNKAEALPHWFRPHCPEIFSGPELEAQFRRAPLWLRLQTDTPADVLAEFDTLGWQWRRPTILATAIELITEADVTRTRAWKDGHVEVQDLGSHLILNTIGIAPGGHWLDACAGAGGKTLQLARLLGPNGTIDAHDVRPQALAELRTRATRAEQVAAFSGRRTAAIRTRNQLADDTYDAVLVDAPCSGSGTWRRAPHLKWTTTDAQITRAADTQRRLLNAFAARVRPRGKLVYATCSLSSRENEEVIGDFLARNPDFEPAEFAENFGATTRRLGLLILPSLHDTDGFFVASLRRR